MVEKYQLFLLKLNFAEKTNPDIEVQSKNAKQKKLINRLSIVNIWLIFAKKRISSGEFQYRRYGAILHGIFTVKNNHIF